VQASAAHIVMSSLMVSACPYAIIGAEGFLGVDRHDVVIPVWQLKQQAAKLVVPGATKKALKGAPKFECAPPTT
jgi:hypothetical protein